MSDRRVVRVITHTVAIAIAWVGAGVVVGVRVGARCGSGIGLSAIAITETSRFDQLFLFEMLQYINWT